MSTRGFVGMVHNGQTLIAYVPNDSDPRYLGMKTLLFTRANIGWIDLVAEQFFALTVVDPDVDPTPEQIAQLEERGFHGITAWIDVENLARGDLGAFLTSGFLPVRTEAPLTAETEPWDMEWGYLINLDADEVETYRMLSHIGMPPYTGGIPFEVIAHCDPAELIGFPAIIESELDKADDPDRELSEIITIRALIEEDRKDEEARKKDEG